MRIANVRGTYHDVGDLAQTAIDYYETALLIDPKYKSALTSVIHISKELGQVEKAQPHIEMMKHVDPSFVAPTNRLGMNSNPNDSFQFDQLLYAILGLLVVILGIIYMLKAR